MTKTISLYAWSKREKIPMSTVCWLRDHGKLPVIKKEKTYYEVFENITKEDLGKYK